MYLRDIIAILLVLGIFPLFFFGGPNYYSKPIFFELWNWGHIIFFTLSNFLIISLLQKFRNTTTIISVIIFTLSLGIIIEILHSKFSRTVDWHDVYRDLLGAGLAIALFLPYFHSALKKIQRYLLIVIISLILFNQITLFKKLKIEIQSQINFPILADFENTDSLEQWSGQSLTLNKQTHLNTGQSLTLSKEHVVSGQNSMKVILFRGSFYAGFTFKNFPSNWQGYKYLTFSIYNPDTKVLKLAIKITDYEHNINSQRYYSRFNKQIKLENGWNHIRIPIKDISKAPKGRKLDISNINRVSFFLTRPSNNTMLYFDNMRLL